MDQQIYLKLDAEHNMWQCEVLISHVAAVITKVKGE